MTLKNCPHPLCHRENDELMKSHAALLRIAKAALEDARDEKARHGDSPGFRQKRKLIQDAIAQAEKVTP